jgi:enoyl-CoA hydratase/carnithine racemase
MLEVSREGRVLRLVLNRPEKRNALNGSLCTALADAIESAGEETGAVLLSGAGKSFCSGMDLDEMLTPAAPGLAEAHERIFTIGRRARVPIIAVVHGAALAGGLGLAANAHIVLASDDATFGLTEIRIGLWPFVVYRSVVDAVGNRRAVELSITGRIFGAAEAAAMGLVHHALPSAELMARAFEIAAAAASASPAAIRTGLRYASENRDADWKESGAAARKYREEVFQSPEFAEGIRAFREKRRN